jgi:hypothetical protein
MVVKRSGALREEEIAEILNNSFTKSVTIINKENRMRFRISG